MTNAPVVPGVGRAILLMLLANLAFAFVDTSTKWLIGAGLVALQLAFMRYAVHFVITLADLQRTRKRRTRIAPRVRLFVGLRAFCLVSSTVANFVALGHLPLSVTSALLFLAPVIVCLLAGALLKERVTRGQWGAVMLGFAGVLVIVWPFGGEINWYAVLMLYPASGMALYAVLTRKLSDAVDPSVLQFYTGALGSAVLLPLGLWVWQMPATPLGWGLLFGIGVFAWAGHEMMTRAHKYAPASLLAPFGYVFVLYLSAGGWLVFGEVPSLRVVLGALAIMTAGVTIWRLKPA